MAARLTMTAAGIIKNASPPSDTDTWQELSHENSIALCDPAIKVNENGMPQQTN